MSKIKVDEIETLDGTKSFLVANLSDAALAVVDGLTSTDVGAALSANQGRVLKGLLDDTNTNVLGKQNTLVSGVNIKTVAGQSLLGAGDAPIVAPETHAATPKTTPVDADELGLSDSAASWALKKLTFANLKTWLTGLFVSRSSSSTIATPSGQASLNINGGTDRANLSLGTGAADSLGGAAGAFGFVHEAATASSLEKRIALVSAVTDGATAGHRGGKLSFTTKVNGDTSLVERMVIDSAGNVGIGKTPTTTLDVGGVAQVSYSAGGASGRAVISVINEESGAAVSLGANSSTHTDFSWGGAGLADTAIVRAGAATSGGLALYTGAGQPLTFWTDSTKRMTIDPSGNVGIGESSPQSELHIKDIAGNARVDVLLEGMAADGSPVAQAAIWARKVQSGAGEARLGCVAFGLDGVTANNRGGYIQFTTKVNGGEALAARMTIDSSGNVLVTGGVLGYGVGAGGTVTQETSKSTAVTLNKPCGRITMHPGELLAGASVIFGVSNSFATSTCVPLVAGYTSAINPDNYRIEVSRTTSSSSFYIRVTNITGAARSEALAIQFAIIQGATS